MPDVIYIYTDGACINNPGPGGFAGIIKFGATTYTVKGGEPGTTNNRMEMRAAIEPLLSLHMILEVQDADITVYSDSKYLVNAFNEWLDVWQQKGWRTKGKQRVKNQDLWMKMLDAVQYRNASFKWIKGHNNHPINELCDRISNEQASKAVHCVKPFITSDVPHDDLSRRCIKRHRPAGGQQTL